MEFGRADLQKIAGKSFQSDRNGIGGGTPESRLGMYSVTPFTEEDIERYLLSCWNFEKMKNIFPSDTKVGSFLGWKGDNVKNCKQMEINGPWVTKIVDHPSGPNRTKKHIDWCYVCGSKQSLMECEDCPCAFHLKCVINYQISKEKLKPELKISNCPHCSTGVPILIGDIVWDKMKTFPWWPARILTPATQPQCLKNSPTPYHVPVQYFGHVQYAWADCRRLIRFLPSHVVLNEIKCDRRKHAIMEALASCSTFNKGA